MEKHKYLNDIFTTNKAFVAAVISTVIGRLLDRELRR